MYKKIIDNLFAKRAVHEKNLQLFLNFTKYNLNDKYKILKSHKLILTNLKKYFQAHS